MKPIHVFLLVCGCVLGGMIGCGSGGGDKAKTEKQPAEKAEAEKASATAAEAAGQKPPRELTNSIGMKLVLIPPGEFMMGSPADEKRRGVDEPQHRVKITKGFYMGATEVTQAQWQKVMGNNPSYFEGDNLPVEQVSWDNAVDFCRKLSATEGKTYRLPTEAEWEYACRAGSTGPYAGNGKLDDMGWHGGNSGGKTHPVGTKQANAWGLYDMHGNVWEWCADWYGVDYYRQSPVSDPEGPNQGAPLRWAPQGARVVRGGSWDSGLTGRFRCADRDYSRGPADRGDRGGFRCARTLE